MKFDIDKFIKVSENLSVSKHLNFEIFLKGIIGRNILDKKEFLNIYDEVYKKYKEKIKQ